LGIREKERDGGGDNGQAQRDGGGGRRGNETGGKGARGVGCPVLYVRVETWTWSILEGVNMYYYQKKTQ